MAENETLDLWGRNSGRWRALLKRVKSGDAPAELADEAIHCLYRTFKIVVGLAPLDQLLDAAERGGPELHELVRRCRDGRDYAQLIEQSAAVESSRECILEGVLHTTLERFFQQIQLKLDWPQMAQFRTDRSEIHRRATNEISRLAGQLARRPSEPPRMPARSKEQKEQQQKAIYRMSLRAS